MVTVFGSTSLSLEKTNNYILPKWHNLSGIKLICLYIEVFCNAVPISLPLRQKLVLESMKEVDSI